MRISYKTMKDQLQEILLSLGVNEVEAEAVAAILTDNTCDGVASHGINRFLKIVEYIEKGYIKTDVKPEVVSSFASMEVVDGHFGMGVTNAVFAMNRALELADKKGIGCVAMRHNNHWMRGATYGLMAARQDKIGLCFTNTLPNMPVWGAKDSRIGNNPMIIAIPYKEQPVVLDMAMSQFSYGKMETTALNGEELPFDGGYDQAGELTREPEEILATGRVLPTGLWKGSGLSIVLDLLVSLLSGGNSTQDIDNYPVETGVSQVFIAIDPSHLGNADQQKETIEKTLAYIHGSIPTNEEGEVRYPGEGSAKRRAKNMKEGILVNETIWTEIRNKADGNKDLQV